MLAYVFWHAKLAAADTREYEARLVDFHRRLIASRPAGLVRSIVSRLRDAPWIAAGGDAYEEWYLVEGSAALDVLNEAAVSGDRRAAHDQIARLAASGSAGLYLRRLGAADEADARHAAWFAKPAGMRYDEMHARLDPLIAAPGATLWGRQMVLGPTDEFCVRSKAPLALPEPFSAASIVLEPLWASSPDLMRRV
jgi:hypothetical protein